MKLQSKGSTQAAFWNFFKQLFGAGILALPHAFTQSGLVAGAILYLIAIVASICSMVLVIHCKHQAVLQLGGAEAEVASYPGLARHACGAVGFWGVTTIVCVLELAFCTGWVICASDSISIVTDSALSRAEIAWMLMPVIGALSCIRWLRQLWFLSLAGFLVYFVGVMGSSYYYIATQAPPHDAPELVVWDSLPQFFGTALYGLEAILMALPIEGSMENSQAAPAVIAGGTTLYGVLCLAFGMLCYSYGLAECGGKGSIITDCLPEGILTTITRIALAVSLVVGYPCILFPVTEICEGIILGTLVTPAKDEALLEERGEERDYEKSDLARASEEEGEEGLREGLRGGLQEGLQPPASKEMSQPQQDKVLQRCCIRFSEVALTCLAASAFKNFNVFTNVVGSLLIPLAGFVLPPVLHLLLMGGPRNIHPGLLLLDAALLALGVGVLVSGIASF